MRFVLFSHSIVSDWNHGNAHFQRGILRELAALGHDCVAFEPADGWSRCNLIAEQGGSAVDRFHALFPQITLRTYEPEPDIDWLLDGADVVLVHEWTDPALVQAIAQRRLRGGDFALLFHDTHHRAITAEADIATMDLDGYDGVLAFGETLAETYRRRGWGRRVFTWHEAADTALFRPRNGIVPTRDLIWVGNWGDGERVRELAEFVIDPVRALGLAGTVHGVRYPADALHRLDEAGIAYGGWIANAEVPAAFARHRVTVHVPRGPYVTHLPGIPTIRVFEALACGIPLICAPWQDSEALFRPGEDFLMARNGGEMRRHLRAVLNDRDLAGSLRANGLERIASRHTCRHRVAELMGILQQIGAPSAALPEAAA